MENARSGFRRKIQNVSLQLKKVAVLGGALGVSEIKQIAIPLNLVLFLLALVAGRSGIPDIEEPPLRKHLDR